MYGLSSPVMFTVAIVIAVALILFILISKGLGIYSYLIALFVGGSLIVYKIYERNFYLDRIPSYLRVSSIQHSESRSLGLGPGGNEASISVYSLPIEVGDELSRRGISFFMHPPSSSKQGYLEGRHIRLHWASTPLVADKTCDLDSAEKGHNIFRCLGICEFGFRVDGAVSRQIFKIATEQGGFYARGPRGTTLVSPNENIVAHLFCS